MAKEWILNSAMNRFQLNFKRNVGPTSESIRKCSPKNLEEWREYYFNNVKSKEHIEDLGKKVEIFGGKKIDGTNVIDNAVQSAWDEAVEVAAKQDRRLTDAEVRLTAMYRANQEWIEQIVKEGYDIYDIGNLRALAGEGLNSGWYSPFYDMEKNEVF